MAALGGSLAGVGLAAAVVGGAVGAIASQLVGMATGNVERFSWSSVAVGAISAGAGAGAGAIVGVAAQGASTATQLAVAVGRSVVGNVISQGVAQAVGLQKKFSWTSVAVAGAGAAAGSAFGQSGLGSSLQGVGGSDILYKTASGMVGSWAGSMASHKKANWGAIAANSFGSALGDSVVGAIQRGDANKVPSGDNINYDEVDMDGEAHKDWSAFSRDTQARGSAGGAQRAANLAALKAPVAPDPYMQDEPIEFFNKNSGLCTPENTNTAPSTSSTRSTTNRRATTAQRSSTVQGPSQQDGGFDFARALGLPPLEKPSLVSPGFVAGIFAGSRSPSPSVGGGSPGAYMSAPTGDGLSPIQRYLSKNEGLYQSPIGSGLYGVAKASGASEETARQIGGAGAMVDAVGSIATIGGSQKASPLQPYGNEKLNTQVDSYINMGKQSRHINDGGSSYKGGGYFTDPSQAQDVLNAYQQGAATIVGRGSDGGHIVIYNGATGYNNNPRAGYVDQPTNVFWIKGTNSPSVVPLAPSKGKRP